MARSLKPSARAMPDVILDRSSRAAMRVSSARPRPRGRRPRSAPAARCASASCGTWASCALISASRIVKCVRTSSGLVKSSRASYSPATGQPAEALEEQRLQDQCRARTPAPRRRASTGAAPPQSGHRPRIARGAIPSGSPTATASSERRHRRARARPGRQSPDRRAPAAGCAAPSPSRRSRRP